MTLLDRARAANFKSTGFDYLRLCLAIAVFIWHAWCFNVSADAPDRVLLGPIGPFVACILPMFFGLSGYLVAGSLQRSKTIASFLFLRAIRIYPALMADSLLCALILGPLFTSLPIWDYFNSPRFWNYFWNIIGHVQYDLPGVFIDNPRNSHVNGQLWTVPFELKCYAVLGALGLFRKFSPKYLIMVCTIFLQVFLSAKDFVIDRTYTMFSGHSLVLAFLWGVCLFQFASVVPFSRWLALAATALVLGVLYAHLPSNIVALPVVYLTVFIGLQTPKMFSVLKTGDYSYGIFLYGSPITQAVATFPALQEWYWSVAIAGPLTLAFAVLSWRMIEKRALSLRRFTGVIDDTVSSAVSRIGGSGVQASRR